MSVGNYFVAIVDIFVWHLLLMEIKSMRIRPVKTIKEHLLCSCTKLMPWPGNCSYRTIYRTRIKTTSRICPSHCSIEEHNYRQNFWYPGNVVSFPSARSETLFTIFPRRAYRKPWRCVVSVKRSLHLFEHELGWLLTSTRIETI